MDTVTDFLGLSNKPVFKNLSKNFFKMSSKTRSLMDCADNILFVWNCEESCLLALNIKRSDSSDTQTMQQTLLPTNPPCFEVERVKANRTSSHVVAFGSPGIIVFELPRRWGKLGMFQGGKAEVMCRTRIVDERHFRCNPHVVVKQVRWHPGSATDSHLLVLSSENTFRFYQVAGDQPTLLKVWNIGRRPSSTRVPILVGLGDTCVDFDFALPSLEGDISENNPVTNTSVTWPVYALQGNGDVFSVKMSRADMSSKVDIQGPLRMFPQADDNYGGDACSILCLQTNPPIVIVATCSGTIYHSLLLMSDDDEGSWNDTRHALYVFESVELELGLGLKEDDDIYACPILLHHDDTAVSRYFCSHDTGVHVMLLPMVTELERYAEAKDEESDLLVPLMKEASSAQYLICTRTSSSSPLAPVQALTIGTSPPVLICLLTTGEVVSVPLMSVTTFHGSSLLSKDNDQSGGLETQRESFVDHIQRLLQRSTSQPLLKLAPSAEPSAQECLELVSRATNVLRDEYLQKQFQVCDEMQRKLRMLRTMKEHQLGELSNIEESRQQLKEAAEHLAEKYEDIKTVTSQVVNTVEQCMLCAHGSQRTKTCTATAPAQCQPEHLSAAYSATHDATKCKHQANSVEESAGSQEPIIPANIVKENLSAKDTEMPGQVTQEHELRMQVALRKLHKARLEISLLECEVQRKWAEERRQEEVHQTEQRRLEDLHQLQLYHMQQAYLTLQRRLEELHNAEKAMVFHSDKF